MHKETYIFTSKAKVYTDITCLARLQFYSSLSQNIVSFIGLFCKKRRIIYSKANVYTDITCLARLQFSTKETYKYTKETYIYTRE